MAQTQNKTHTFEVDGKVFVLGLFWQPLSSSIGAERKKEMRTLAKDLAFDSAVVRESGMYCAGFVSAKDVKVGVLSAAAAVADALEAQHHAKNFVYVAPLADGRWMYVAQRDGMILPDSGDMAFASEDAARSQLLEHMSLGEWELVVAPAIWGIDKAVEQPFDSLLPRTKHGKGRLKVSGRWRVLPVDGKRAAMFLHAGQAVIGALVVVGVVVGVLYYGHWKAERAAQAKLAAMLAAASRKPVKPVHPWIAEPPAADVLLACERAQNAQNLFPGNWALTSITCAAGTLTVSWKAAAGGWVAHLLQIEPRAVVGAGGATASVRTPLPPLPPGGDEPLEARDERVDAMYAGAQKYGVRLTFAAAHERPVLPGQRSKTLPPDWATLAWKVEGVALPRAVLAALAGPGFRMAAMQAKWSDGRLLWTMEGNQYVRP